MKFELSPLPYAKYALEPYMSKETLDYHYEKHHRGYLTKLQGLIAGQPMADRSLEEIITSSDGEVLNNAAQVWNHTFFWNCMQPNGGGEPSGDVARLIRDTYGSFQNFEESFVAAGRGDSVPAMHGSSFTASVSGVATHSTRKTRCSTSKRRS